MICKLFLQKFVYLFFHVGDCVYMIAQQIKEAVQAHVCFCGLCAPMIGLVPFPKTEDSEKESDSEKEPEIVADLAAA